VLANQTDQDLRDLYRALADGKITDADAEAAETALHARRARRAPSRPPVRLPRAANRRAKIFGQGRGRPIDRNARARIMHRACVLRGRRTITRADLDVLRALLFDFLNGEDGRCFPSYQRIAKLAHCVCSTVAEAIKRLEAAGLLTWENRIARIRERCAGLLGPLSGWRERVIRISNAYRFPSESDFRRGTNKQDRFPLFASVAEAETELAFEGASATFVPRRPSSCTN
jgi:hypothetical protein